MNRKTTDVTVETRFRSSEARHLFAYCERHALATIDEALKHAVLTAVSGLTPAAKVKIAGKVPFTELIRELRSPAPRPSLHDSMVLSFTLTDEQARKLETYKRLHGCRTLFAAPRHAFYAQAIRGDASCWTGPLPVAFT